MSPTPRLEIAFGISATVDPAAADWEDVSAYLRAFDGGPGGRQRNLDRVEAGVMTFRLDNRDRRFDPENTAGPYYPNVLPMAHVRFTEDETVSPVFRGFVDKWPQAWPNKKDSSVTLPCTDVFKILANIDLPGSFWALELGEAALQPSSWWRLGEPARSTLVRDSGPSGFTGSVVGTPRFGEGSLVAFDSHTAVSFSSGDRIVLPVAASITSDVFTVEAWFSTETVSTSNVQEIYTQNTAAFAEYLLIRMIGVGVDDGKLVVSLKWKSGSTVEIETSDRFDDGKSHYLAVVCNGVNRLSIFVDGVEEAFTTALGTSDGFNPAAAAIGNTVTQVAGFESFWRGVLDEVAIWNGTALSADLIRGHYDNGVGYAFDYSALSRMTQSGDYVRFMLLAADLPITLWDVAEGSGASSMQPHAFGGKALPYTLQLAETEETYLYVAPDGKVTFRARTDFQISPRNSSQLTFGDDPDDPNEIPYVDLVLEPADEERVYNNVVAARESGTAFEVNNATSQTRYFKRTLDRTSLLHDNDEEVIDHANHLLNRYADPKTDVRSLTVMLADPRVPVDDILALRLGDLVTVWRRPLEDGLPGTPIEKTVRVESMNHSGERDPQTWRVTFWFSGWDATVDQYWIVGDPVYSVVGSTTRVGF